MVGQVDKGEWYEISIKPVAENDVDRVSFYLFELGCRGIVEEMDEVIAYFDRLDYDTINELNLYCETNGFQVEMSNVPAADWEAEWKKNFKPIKITDRIVVKPSWTELEADDDKLVITIDPKMAFGVGTHETTQMVLRFVERYLKPGREVLDVGTGTGILAICAVRLGASSVVALDNDEDAVANAKNNVEINGVKEKVNIQQQNIQEFVSDQRFDLILANLNRATILNILDQIFYLLKDDGQLVLSGILVSEYTMVLDSLNEMGCRIEAESESGDWKALVVSPD